LLAVEVLAVVIIQVKAALAVVLAVLDHPLEH
jgi:hypothetical protein